MRLFANRYFEEVSEGGEPAASADQSLLDGAEPTLAEGEYFLAEGIKGVGDAPEWFDSNRFKSVDQQAKSYLELEKKFGGFKGTPKDGYSLPEGVDSEDEAVKAFIELASDGNMSQDFFDKGFELFQAQMGVSEEVTTENEMAKLGDNAQQRIKTVETFLRNNAGDKYSELQSMVTTADSVALIEAMINVMAPKKLPIDGGEHPEGLTWDDIEKEMFRKNEEGQLLRSVDIKHERKIQDMMKQFGGNKPNQVVMHG